MSAENIRNALGLLLEDPDDAEAWRSLEVALGTEDEGGEVDLLVATREQQEQRRVWHAVARLLALEVKLAANPRVAAAMQFERGRVHHEELLESDTALACFKSVLELTPENEAARQTVRELEQARDKWSESAERCLIESLEAPDPGMRARFLVSAAEVTYRYGGRNDEGLAKVLDYLRQARELDPQNRRASFLQALVHHRKGDWKKLATTLQERASTAPAKADRLAAADRLAQVALKRLDDKALAISAYEAMLDLDPGHSDALAFLVEHYSEAKEWDHLAALYEDQLQSGAVKPSDELGVWVQLAMLNWKTRSKPDAAEPYFDKVRRVDPKHQGMLQFFRERCKAKGDNARLMTILTDAQRAHDDSDQKRALLEEIAGLAEGQENAKRAIEQYKTILRSDPENLEAREKLKNLYLQTESYNAVVELYRQDLSRLPKEDAKGRIAVLRQIGSIYRDRVHNDAALLQVLTQILQHDESDVEAVRQLTRVYEALGRWRDLLNTQQRLAELTESPAEKISLLRSVARRWLDQFSNVQNAIAGYEALLSATGGEDVEAREKLVDLYKKRRTWPKLYELYQSQLELLEGRKRAELLQEMAALAAERLDRGEDAVRLLKEVLAIDPRAEGVLDALERQAEKQKDFHTAAEVLDRRIALCSSSTGSEKADDEKTKLALLQKLGELYSDKLEDEASATKVWRRVLEVSPGHKRALRVLRQAFVTAGDWDGLEQLHGEQNDYEGLADFLSTSADRSEDPEQKTALSFRAARVYEEHLNAPERAARSYERVLAIDEKNMRAAKALLPLYEREEKWSRLPKLYGVLLDATDDVDEKIATLQKMAEVSGGPLANKAAALGYARQAYELRPDDAGLERLHEWSQQSGEWSAFIDAVQGRLDNTAAPSARGPGAPRVKKKRARELKQMLAHVYAHEAGKLDEAVKIYRELVETEPGDQDTIQQLEDLLRAADRRDDLRWLFGLQADRLEGEERAAALEEWASVEEEGFGEPERAISLLQQAVEAQVDRISALASLTRLLLAAERWAAASDAMEKHRDALEGNERAELELRLATLLLDKLDRPADAFEACVLALEDLDDKAPAVMLLEHLLELPATRARAAEQLERLYAEAGKHKERVAAIRALLEKEERAERRLELCRRLADVYHDDLHDAGASLDVVLNSLLEAPRELDLWDRAEKLCVESGRPTDLAEAYRTHLTPSEGAPHGAVGQELALELCERAAALHEDQLGDAEGAVPYLERVLSHDARDERAFERLKHILTAAERWDDLEAIYRRAIEACERDADRIELLREAALIAEEMIGSDERAIAYNERIVSLDSLHQGGLEALERLYGREQRFADLAKLIEGRLDTATDAESVPLRLQLVELYLHKLDRPGKVLGHLEAVLRLRPDDHEARGYAEEALEAPGLRQAAAALLDGVYEQRDEVRDLVRVLEVRLEGAADDDARREILRRIATLRDERIKDDAGAFEAFRKLAPLEPDDADLRHRLIEIGKRLGENAKLAEALVATAAVCPLPPTRGEILMEAAALYRKKLDQPERAEQVYRQVLEIDPDDPMLVVPASAALAEIHEAAGDHARLAEALGLQVRLTADSDERAKLHARIASLYEDVLGKTDEAISAWKARLADDVTDVTALWALERLYRQTSKWRELVDVLRHLEQAAEDGDERRRCMTKAAEVLADQLNETAEAINAWRAVADDFGPEPDTLEALARLYRRAERWDDLAEVLDVWLSLTEDLHKRVALHAQLGDVRREHLNDSPGALAAYREVLILDPSHAATRDALEKMLEATDPEIRREAAELIGPLYEADGDAQRLLKVLDIEIESTFEPGQRLAKLKTALRTAEDVVHNQAQAFDYAVRAVREAIGDPTLGEWIETAERLAAETQRWHDLLALYEAVVEEMLDAEVQQKARLRAGELAQTRLDDRARAIKHYRGALDAQADDQRAMIALEELYQETGEQAALLEILKLRAEAAADDTERLAFLHRVAELQAGPLAARDAAIETYEEITTLALDPRAVEALEKLYGEAERHEQLIDLYQRQLDDTNVKRPADLRVKIARVAAERMDDGARALDELGEALNLEPMHAEAITMLEGILEKSKEPEQRAQVAQMLEPVYLRTADWAKLRLVLEARLDSSQDPSERAELLRQLATLYEEQLEDFPAALETVAKRLREDPSDSEVWDEIERIGRLLGDGQEQRVAGIFADALSDVGADDPKTAALSQRTGDLYRAVGKLDDALKWYRRAYEFSPDSRELFDAIDRTLVDLGQHEERVNHYKSAITGFDDDTRVRALHVIAELQREKLDRQDDAILTLLEVLDIDDRNAPAQDALVELYQKAQRWNDLADLYERRADQADDPEKAAPHRLALARLLAREESSRDRAVDQLETLTIELPFHQEAVAELEKLVDDPALEQRVIDVLRPLYDRADDWRGLIRLNEHRLALAQDVDEKVEILADTARLWEDLGGSAKEGFAVVRKAFALRPDDETTRVNLDRLAGQLDAWEELAASYSEAIDSAEDALVKRPLLEALAAICDERLDDPRRALASLFELSELDPGDPDLLERLDTLCTLLGDWNRLGQVLARKAENALDPLDKSSLLRRLGELKRDMLDDEDGAVATYEEALQVEPESVGALDRLIALYKQRDDHQRLVELIEQRVGVASPEEEELRLSLLHEAAERYQSKLDRAADAIRMLSLALELRPTDREVLRRLETLYRSEQMFEELLENLKAQAAVAEDAVERVALRNKTGDLYLERFDNAFDALEQYRLVLEETPADEHARVAVRRLGEEHEELRLEVASLLEPVLAQLERHQELVEVMELRLKAQTDPVERSKTLTAIGMLREEQLEDEPGARDALLRALAETPEQTSLHDDIERLCELTSEWKGYAEALETRAAAAYDAILQGDLYARLGRVTEERLKEAERAIAAYTKAAELAEDPAPLLAALDRLYVATGDPRELARVLERRVEIEPSESAQAEINYRLAMLQIESFKDKRAGLETLRMVVDLKPEHAGARAALEQLTDDAELFEQAAEALDIVYRVAQDSAARAAIRSKRISYAPTAGERVRLRIELARMLEDESFDTSSAQRVIEAALRDDPSDAEVHAELERLAATNAAGKDGAEAWRRAATALTEAVTEATKSETGLDREQACDLLLRASRWLAGNVGDRALAEQALGKAYELAEGAEQRRVDVLVAIEELQRVPGRERDLVATLRKLADLARTAAAPIGREAVELWREAKVLAETELEDAALAEQILRDVIAADDADLWALGELCTVAERKGDHQELYKLLERRIELTPEADLLRELRLRAAEVAAEHLGKPDAALDLYEQVFDVDPRDAVAVEALPKLYQKLERWQDMLRFLQRQVELADTPAERAALRLRCATLCIDTLGTVSDGIAELQAVLDEQPGHAEAVVRLTKVLEKDGRHDELAGLLQEQIEVARAKGDRPAELAFRVRLAELLETRLNDPDRAIDGYLGVLDADPGFRPALEALARLYEQQGQAVNAAEVIEKLLDGAPATDGASELVRLALRARDLYASVGDQTGASRAVERALERSAQLDKSQIGQLRDALRSLYKESEAWDKLAALVTREADEAATPDEKVVLFRQAAEIQAQQRADHAAAAGLLERALALKSEDRDLMLALCDEYTASKRSGDAIAILNRVVESYGGRRSKELADIHHRIAAAHREAGNFTAALAELDSARKMDPGSIEILFELGHLSLSLSDEAKSDDDKAEHIKRAGNSFRSLLLQRLDKDSPVSKAEVFYYLAEVNRRENDPKKAIQMLERALATDKGLEKAQALLDQLKA